MITGEIMKYTRPNLYLLAFLMLVLTSCAGKEEETAPPSQGMLINVDFQEVHLCSRISPEITVAYAPEGTKFYDIRLMEEGPVERYLGGGTWKEDGTGLIPEGVLTRHYTGPCPPADRRVAYTYVVTAMESENSQPLATRLYRFTPDF